MRTSTTDVEVVARFPVDDREHLGAFHLQDCSVRRTDAGLLRLAPVPRTQR